MFNDLLGRLTTATVGFMLFVVGHSDAGPFAALAPGGQVNDAQTSLLYYAATGELAIDPPDTGLTSLNIESETGIFTDVGACERALLGLAGGRQKRCTQREIVVGAGLAFHFRTFERVAQAGLAEEFLLADLSVTGMLPGGEDLGDVDLVYSTGSILSGGSFNDDRFSLVYDAETGELGLDYVTPTAGGALGLLNIVSEAGIFTGTVDTGLPGGLGQFGNHADNQILFWRLETGVKKPFSFGRVAEPQLSEEFLLHDLTVNGIWLGAAGDIGPVDLIYIPEPAGFLLLAVGLVVAFAIWRQHRPASERRPGESGVA